MSFVIVRAAGASGGGGSGEVAANNATGAVVGLVGGSTQDICSMPIVGWKYRGFTATGDHDAEVWLEVDGLKVEGQAAKLTIVKWPSVILPNPWQLDGTTATLRVKNTDDTAGSYEGTLLGE